MCHCNYSPHFNWQKKVLIQTEIFVEGYSLPRKQEGLSSGDIQFQYGGDTNSADRGTFHFGQLRLIYSVVSNSDHTVSSGKAICEK